MKPTFSAMRCDRMLSPAVVTTSDRSSTRPHRGFADAYEAKYGEPLNEDTIWVVGPTVALGFEGNDNFNRTAARRVFQP